MGIQDHTDLSGLEYATNLEELTFGGAPRVRGSLSPLSPLSGLAHLERLVLMGEVTELETLPHPPEPKGAYALACWYYRCDGDRATKRILRN